MRGSAESPQAGDDDRHVVEGRRRLLGEVAGQPASRVPLAPVAIVQGDQRREPYRFVEAEAAAVERCRLGQDEAAGFECAVERRPC
jgi:hypothetical protein